MASGDCGARLSSQSIKGHGVLHSARRWTCSQPPPTSICELVTAVAWQPAPPCAHAPAVARCSFPRPYFAVGRVGVPPGVCIVCASYRTTTSRWLPSASRCLSPIFWVLRSWLPPTKSPPRPPSTSVTRICQSVWAIACDAATALLTASKRPASSRDLWAHSLTSMQPGVGGLRAKPPS